MVFSNTNSKHTKKLFIDKSIWLFIIYHMFFKVKIIQTNRKISKYLYVYWNDKNQQRRWAALRWWKSESSHTPFCTFNLNFVNIFQWFNYITITIFMLFNWYFTFHLITFIWLSHFSSLLLFWEVHNFDLWDSFFT